MIRTIPLSLNLLGYLMKQDDRDIILMADDFYYAMYPESIKLGKKEKLQDLAEEKGAKIFEFCGGVKAGYRDTYGRSTSESMADNSIHAFFVVENEKELEARFSVVEVIGS